MSMPPVPPPPSLDSEDRRKHLEFVQAAIARMSSASGLAKGWALSVATVAYGYAGTQDAVNAALVGVFAVVLFAWVDAGYLKLEREFRHLYDGIRLGRVATFDMHARGYCDGRPAAEVRNCTWMCVVRSWTIVRFYGLMALAGVFVAGWILLQN
ncbi:hypothetical protein [Oerskovia paurometabola]|uniref:hypothetical protein n=1 Tax=Oerskovia paurometabola TaxID=162170 RepID=UPI00382F52D1